ncbi:MAG: hypothetical protein WA639_06055 [Candidatus Acidiferrum sp.]
MKSVKSLLAVAFFVLPALVATAAYTQDTATTQDASASSDRELNLRAYTELLRADVKAKRVAIITEIMQFNDADAATFWPIFRDYDHELSKLGDTKVQLITDYIKNYDNITNEKADELMSAALALEAQRAELKKKYFDIMKKALSARTAARFFQVENQMQQVVDLQISANLPTMQ